MVAKCSGAKTIATKRLLALLILLLQLLRITTITATVVLSRRKMDYYEWLHHGRKAQLKWAAWSCTIGMKLQLKHVEAGEEDEVKKKLIEGVK